MKPQAGFCAPLPRGFSLVEVILVIVVLAIGMVALVPLFGGLSSGWSQTGDVQTGTQLVQQCGEHILGTRRRQTGGYALIDSNICSGLTTAGGFSAPTVTTNPAYAGTGCFAVPCNLVTITVSKGVSVLALTTLLLQ
jgi:prepilin-type N-terminal cleavage/methylation domain-containing protein